jgi:hypothetical protein
MPEISLVSVLIVAAVAFVAPLILGLVEMDGPLHFMALIGLAFLLFLAGIEIGRRLALGRTVPTRRPYSLSCEAARTRSSSRA